MMAGARSRSRSVDALLTHPIREANAFPRQVLVETRPLPQFNDLRVGRFQPSQTAASPPSATALRRRARTPVPRAPSRRRRAHTPDVSLTRRRGRLRRLRSLVRPPRRRRRGRGRGRGLLRRRVNRRVVSRGGSALDVDAARQGGQTAARLASVAAAGRGRDGDGGRGEVAGHAPPRERRGGGSGLRLGWRYVTACNSPVGTRERRGGGSWRWRRRSRSAAEVRRRREARGQSVRGTE